MRDGAPLAFSITFPPVGAYGFKVEISSEYFMSCVELAATMLKVLCGVMNESVKAVYIFIQRISSSQNSRIRIRALVRFAGAMHVLLRELKVKL